MKAAQGKQQKQQNQTVPEAMRELSQSQRESARFLNPEDAEAVVIDALRRRAVMEVIPSDRKETLTHTAVFFVSLTLAPPVRQHANAPQRHSPCSPVVHSLHVIPSSFRVQLMTSFPRENFSTPPSVSSIASRSTQSFAHR